MERFKELSSPEGYLGDHLSIDEMNPVFDEKGIVTLTTEHWAQIFEPGRIVLLGSNEHPDEEGFGKVIAVDKKNSIIKVELMD